MSVASKTTLRTAWMESAAVIRAMGEGKHFLLVSRTGNERPEQEARFLIRHLEFFLMPHRSEPAREGIRPEFAGYLETDAASADNNGKEITIRYRAIVTEAVMVMEGTQTEGMAPYHIWTDAFLREQVRWDPKDPALVMTCKVHRLDPPLVIPHRPEYDGPDSWVDLPEEEELPAMAFEPVLENTDYLRVVVDLKKLVAEAQRNPSEEPEPESPAPSPSDDAKRLPASS